MTHAWQHLSVLIAGCGSIGKRHARNLAALGITDIRCFDPVAAQIESLVAETPIARPFGSYAEGLAAAPDCVWIMTPPRLHIPMALDALRAGCHVFSEKPICDSRDGIDDLQSALAASDRTMMVGLCFRFHEGLVKAKRLLDEGRIGRVVTIRALVGEPMPEIRPDYREVWSPETIRWGAFDLTHDIDLAIWYAGQDVHRVECECGSFSDIGLRVPDVADILIGFEDRCSATVHLDFFQTPRRRQIELIGTDGVIIVEFSSWDECTVAAWSRNVGAWERDTIATERDDMFRDEIREFLQAVTTGKQVSCTVDEALKSVDVVLRSVVSGDLD